MEAARPLRKNFFWQKTKALIGRRGENGVNEGVESLTF